MTATLVLPGSATEAEWLERRRHGVTASEIAILMGLSPYGSPFELYHRKTGALPPGGPDSDVMERGRVLEPVVVAKFAARHPEFAEGGDGRALFAHRDRPWQMATPDRILYDPARISGPDLGILEAKTSGSYDGWGDDGTDDIPVHYRCQVLWQMDVTGVGQGFVACLFIEPWKLRVYRLVLDDQAQADLKVMRSAARRFLERIDHGDPPDVDWRPATTGALKALHPSVQDLDVPVSSQLAGWYMAACRNEKHWDERKALYGNRILQAVGDGRRAVDPGRGGAVIAARQVFDQRRVSASKVRELHPGVAAECTVTSTVSKLVPARAPKEPAS